jgi:hypothetical protein
MSLLQKDLEEKFEKMVIATLAPPYKARLRAPDNWSTESGRTKTRTVSHKDSILCNGHVVDFVVYHIESFLDSNKASPYKFYMETDADEQTVILRFQAE